MTRILETAPGTPSRWAESHYHDDGRFDYAHLGVNNHRFATVRTRAQVDAHLAYIPPEDT